MSSEDDLGADSARFDVRAVPPPEVLRQLAAEPDPIALTFTRCGHSLQKHGYRPTGSIYPRVAGPPDRYNSAAMRIVDDIFDSPGTVVHQKTRIRHRETVVFLEVVAVDGRKLGFRWNGLLGAFEFEGFREPLPRQDDRL